MHRVLQRGAALAQHQIPATEVSWDDLRTFLACAQTLSFRKASLELGINNTTISRALDRLEEHLGQKLFIRHQSGLALTDEGNKILADVRVMERASFNVLRHASQSSSTPSGTVRVAVTEGPGNFWILPRLIDFQNTHRRLTVDLQCAMGQADVARLEADISIQFEPPTDNEIIARRIGRMHIYPFVSVNYARQFGVPQSKADLKNHRIVQQSAPQVDDTAYCRLCELETLEGIVGIKTNSSVATLLAVERDAGIGFLPSVSTAMGLPLVAVDIGVIHHMDFWLTYHPDLRNSAKHMIVVDWLARLFDGRTYPCFRDEFIHPDKLVTMMPQEKKLARLGSLEALFTK